MNIRKLVFLAGMAIAGLAASSAQAALLFTVHWGRTNIDETFQVDPGFPGVLSDAGSGRDADFAIRNDSLGNLLLQVGGPGDAYYFATGYGDSDTYSTHDTEAFSTSKVFFDGTNLFLQAYAGETATASDGTTISISAVPEPATWAMMLAGFASIAFFASRAPIHQKRLGRV